MNFAAWSKHFAHSEAVYWICVEDDVTLRATGWTDLEQFVSQYMKDNPVPDSDSLLKLDVVNDVHVQATGQLAFLRYKKLHRMPGGQSKTILESRVFQKDGEDWKIVSMISAPGYLTTNSSANVFTHKDAALQQAAAPAE